MAFIGIFLLIVFGVGLIGWFLFKMNSYEEHANYTEQYSTSPVQFKTHIEASRCTSEIRGVEEEEEAPSPVAPPKGSTTMWGKALLDASGVLGQLDGIEKPTTQKVKANPKAKRKTKPKTVAAKKKATPRKKASTKKKVVTKPKAKKKSPTKKKAVAKKKATAKPKAKKK